MADNKKSTIKFYTIAFELYYDDKREIKKGQIAEFLNKIEDGIENKILPSKVSLTGKDVYIFKYNRSNQKPKYNFIIPFGTVKNNATFKGDEKNDFEVTEVTDKLFNINLLYYIEEYQIALITAFREGPSVKYMEDFLNNFIPDESNIKIKIRPIIHKTTVKALSNSQEIKSLTINFDLGEDINNYFNSITSSNSQNSVSLIKSLLDICQDSSQEFNSDSLKITLNVDKGNKTMRIDHIVKLLSLLDLNNEIIKEIEVKYRNNSNERLLIGHLKNDNIVANYKIDYGKTKSIMFSLSQAANNIIQENYSLISSNETEYFKKSSNMYEISPSYSFNNDLTDTGEKNNVKKRKKHKKK